MSIAAAVCPAIFLFGNAAYWFLYATVYPYWFSPLRALPTADGHSIFTGHLLKTLFSGNPTALFGQWTRKWPKAPFIRHFSVGRGEVLTPNTLAAVRGILQDHAYDLDKSHLLKSMLEEFFKDGVFFAMGEDHRRLRRVFAGLLSKPKMRDMLGKIQDCAAVMREEIDTKIKGPENGAIYFQQLSAQTTLNIIGLVIMGKDLRTFRSTSSGLTFEQCFNIYLFPSTMGKIILFFNHVVPLRWLPIKANRQHFEANSEVRKMLGELIQERFDQAIAQEKNGEKLDSDSDLLDKMVQANRKENMMSITEMQDTIMQLVMAGHYTTSSTLSFVLAELVRRPEVVARLRQEIAKAREMHPVLDGHAIDSIAYVNNVIHETLRVYPPTIVLNWQSVKAFSVEGVHIPKGTQVDIIPSLIHQNPSIWGEDAHLFNPDRWDNLDEVSGNVFALEAFLNGPRICPGINVAMLQIKVLLIELLENFDFELVDKTQELACDNPSITLLSIKGDLHLRFCRRSW